MAIVDPSSIIEHCAISNVPDDFSGLVEMHPEQSSKPKAAIKDFICRSALHSGQGKYYELDWEGHHESALSSKLIDEVQSAWRVGVESLLKKRQGKKRVKPKPRDDDQAQNEESSDGQASSYENEEESSREEDEIEDEGDDDCDTSSEAKPKSPSRREKRKLSTLTPNSKTASRIKKRRKIAGRDLSMMFSSSHLATDHVRFENLPPDPYLRAMRLLHVGSRPDALPCREDEYMEVMSAVLSLLEEGSGGCVCK